jgi:hypothetical protein
MGDAVSVRDFKKVVHLTSLPYRLMPKLPIKAPGQVRLWRYISCFLLTPTQLPPSHQDAWLLAHVLGHPSTIRKGTPSIIPDALKIYDCLRRPFSQASQESTRINGQLISLNPERTDPLIGANPGVEDFKKWGDALHKNWEWGESFGYICILTSVLNLLSGNVISLELHHRCGCRGSQGSDGCTVTVDGELDITMVEERERLEWAHRMLLYKHKKRPTMPIISDYTRHEPRSSFGEWNSHSI